MEESVGKRLSKERLKRGLSLDEAAHATRLRPDKILALENDDYSPFASNVYAKGFLQIYGRFLGVDVAAFASTLEGNSGISIEDYQYLNNNAPGRREERSSSVVRVERSGLGLGSLFMFLLMVALLGAGFYFYVNWQRIAGEPVAHFNIATPVPVGPAGAAISPVNPPAPGAAPVSPTAPPAVALPALRAAIPGAPPSVADRDFVNPATAAAPAASNEVLVQPLRKTRITVRRDDPKSPPIFEDFLYPDAPPLKLKGARFFIEAADPSAIQIRKNGAPMAYQSPNGEVQ